MKCLNQSFLLLSQSRRTSILTLSSINNSSISALVNPSESSSLFTGISEGDEDVGEGSFSAVSIWRGRAGDGSGGKRNKAMTDIQTIRHTTAVIQIAPFSITFPRVPSFSRFSSEHQALLFQSLWQPLPKLHGNHIA